MSITSPDNHQALQQTIEETRRGNTIAQVAYGNSAFLHNQPSVTDNTLDIGQFKIEGTLSEIQNGTWSVDGTVLENVQYSGEIPAVGSRAKIEGIVKNNETFISRIEIKNQQTGMIKVEGKFSGKKQNGIADISGLSVEINDDSSNELKAGDEVELRGKSGAAKFEVTNRESSQGRLGTTIAFNGILTAVDANSSIITVKMTGNQIQVNISKAIITDLSEGRKILSHDLIQMIGQDIKLNGLYKQDNIFYAQQVRIDTEE